MNFSFVGKYLIIRAPLWRRLKFDTIDLLSFFCYFTYFAYAFSNNAAQNSVGLAERM